MHSIPAIILINRVIKSLHLEHTLFNPQIPDQILQGNRVDIAATGVAALNTGVTNHRIQAA